MINKHLLSLLILIIGSVCYGQQTDTLIKIMRDHLKFKGQNPVFSIHTYISKGDRVFNEAVGLSDGRTERAITSDLAIFINSLFEGRLYKNDSTLKSMTTMRPHTLKSGKVSYYGLGLYQYNFNGDICYGHDGFWGSLVAYCPSKKNTFCGSVNQVSPSFNTGEFIALLLKCFTDPKL